MKKYIVNIISEDPEEELESFEYFTGSDEDEDEDNDEFEERNTAEQFRKILERSLKLTKDIVFESNGETIKISDAAYEHGFYYTVYASQKDFEDDNDSYGGMCTGSLSDAIEMAITLR